MHLRSLTSRVIVTHLLKSYWPLAALSKRLKRTTTSLLSELRNAESTATLKEHKVNYVAQQLKEVAAVAASLAAT
jgi:hypothetical protein